MSAIARSTPLTGGATLLGSVADGSVFPPQVTIDGSDTAADGYPVGNYQPVTGDRVILRKVGRQLAIDGTFWDPTAGVAQQPSAWINTKSAAAIALTAATWRETGPDTTTDGGGAGQVTRVGATLVIPIIGYYMIIIRVQFPAIAGAANRILVTPALAGLGTAGAVNDQLHNNTYPIMTNGPVVVSHPIPALYNPGDLVAAYLYSSQTLTIPANGLVVYGWRVS